MRYVTVACQLLLGAVFAVSLTGKLRSREAWSGFRSSVRQLGRIPESVVGVTAVAVVAAELLIVVLLVVPVTTAVGMLAAGALLIGFTGVLVAGWRRGTQAPCRCFGASSSPVGLPQVVRNALLVAAAAAGAVTALGGTGSAALPPHPAGLLVAALAGLAAAATLILLDELVELFVGPAIGARAADERSAQWPISPRR